MKRRPNVRYRAPRTSGPELFAQAGEAIRSFEPEQLRQIMSDAAESAFKDLGGESLERRLRACEHTLDVYEQDLERTMSHENPDKFRWRVKPTDHIRTGREIDNLVKQIAELRERAWSMAVEIVEHLMQQPQSAPQNAPKQAPKDAPQRQPETAAPANAYPQSAAEKTTATEDRGKPKDATPVAA